MEGELGKFECPKSQSQLESHRKAKVCPVSIGENKTHALLDTGADVSLVSSKLLERIRNCISRNSICPSKLEVRGVTGQSLRIKGEFELPVRLKSRTLARTFIIVETLGHPMLLGSDFCQHLGPN